MSRRRTNGDGSIYQRADGIWCAAVVTPDRRRKYVYGSSRNEVRQKLTVLVHSKDAGLFVDSGGMRVAQYLDRWLNDVVKPSVRPWTFAGYEVNVRLHINPVVGRIPLEGLSPLHVQTLINQKLRDGLSPKSVQYVHQTLRTALKQATRWGLIARNPAAQVDGPRVEPYEAQPFSVEEARRFLDAIKGERLQALYSVALTMGLRQGEALGLRWQDVDLELGTLRIAKQLQRIDGQFHLVEPKTKRSRRTLALPAITARELRNHHNRQECERDIGGAGWNHRDLVFTRSDGEPLDGTVVTHQFHRLLDRAGLPQRRFHDLRHSCATLLQAQDVSPRVAMEILGHSHIAVTMNTYTKVVTALKRDAAKRIDELVNDVDI